MRRTLRLLAIAGACGLPLLCGCGDARREEAVPEPNGAVYLDRIAPGSPLENAGFKSGDRLLAWRRGDESGSVQRFTDLWDLEFEAASRGAVTLTAERAGRRFRHPVPAGRWRSLARPALAPAELERYRRAEAELAAGRSDAAAALYEALRDSTTDRPKKVWLSWKLSSLRPSDPVADWEHAMDAATDSGDSRLEAWIAGELCLAQARFGAFDAAGTQCERALELRRSFGQKVAALEIEYRLARLAASLGDPHASGRRSEEVITRLRALAPESSTIIRALLAAARAHATLDDMPAAFEYARQAVATAEKTAPRGMDHQAALMSLGIFHWFAEEWDRAEAALANALEILEAIDPNNEDVANTLNNLGIVAYAKGDLASAERYYQRSLEFRDRVAPNPLGSSRSLNNLANLALVRGDVALATHYHRQVLALREALAPGSLDVATPLLNLGGDLVEQGDLEQGEHYLQRALEIQRRLVPGSRDLALTLQSLGELELARGRLEWAEEYLREALAVAVEVAPNGVIEAAVSRSLGRTAARRGDAPEAEAHFRRSSRLLGLIAPDTLQAAISHHALGSHLREAGRPEEALPALRSAALALDRQFSLLGGTDEVRVQFRASWRRVYHDLAAVLLTLDRPAEAFEVTERGRARAFLFMMRARELHLETALPPELEQARLDAEAAYERVTEDLADRLAAGDEEAVEQLLAVRRELSLRRDGLAESALAAAPRLAELEGVLGLQAARAALGDGMAALSYTVGEHTSWLWVLDPARGLEVFELGIGEEELRTLVTRFRLMLEARSPAADIRGLGAELYGLLIAPAAASLETADRLLIVPDGPLHRLAFAALARPDSSPGGWLVAWKPLHFAPSVSAWDRLRSRTAAAPASVVAFADPDPPDPGAVKRPGFPSALPRLPGARQEVDRIAGLFPSSAEVLVGRRASEAAAKEGGRRARYLHFASHAYVDPISPLDSALVLAPGNRADGRRENGLLEAWEVLRDLPLDAELVTLSACETGAGNAAAEEGILGLTRAFQLAGARAVLASLWQVSDRATAELMTRFYQGLHAGLPQDEALRQSQLRLLRPVRPGHAEKPGERGNAFTRLRTLWAGTDAEAAPLDYSHPAYWAGFQLYGYGQ